MGMKRQNVISVYVNELINIYANWLIYIDANDFKRLRFIPETRNSKYTVNYDDNNVYLQF